MTHWFALAVVAVAVHLVHYKPLAVVVGPVELFIPRQLELLSKPTQLRLALAALVKQLHLPVLRQTVAILLEWD